MASFGGQVVSPISQPYRDVPPDPPRDRLVYLIFSL